MDIGDELHLLQKAQIAHLKAGKASAKISSQYADFANVFSPKLAIELPKHININNHVIKLVDDWQLPYGSIYSLGPVESETWKDYIKNNLANSFIRPSKYLAGAYIFFNKISKRSLRLCVYYEGLNNLTIKNKYPLFLVGKSFD